MRESIGYRPLVRSSSASPVFLPWGRRDGVVRIEGERDGIFDGRSITVLRGASITGELGGDVIEIYGVVYGRVRGAAVRVRASGRVEGEVEYGTLKVDPGATVNARCVPF